MAARNGYLYRLMCVLLLGVCALGDTVSAATYTGNCGADGNNLTWSLDTYTGVLTISGTGEMASYYGTGTPRPWESYIASIKSVILPEGITAIGTWAFRNHTSLATVNLPSTLTNIGSQAFCATAITSVEIPSGLTGINHWAFKDCASLTTVRLPASIANLPTPGAFCGCTSLQEVYVLWETADKIPACSNSSNFFHDLSTKPKLYVPCGTTSLYKNKGWANKFTLTEVVANGTCGASGDNLTWSLNTCGVLTISGSGAMADWDNKEDVPWYSYRESITSVAVGDQVTSIGNCAFYGCSNMSSCSIPNSVTQIGSASFRACSKLTSMAIPSVTNLAAYAFHGCSMLTSVTLSNNLTELKSCTFQNCSSLAIITIPKKVTDVGWAAFYGCNALTDIYVSWTENIPKWVNITNKDPQTDITLHVPCNAIDLYEKTSGWKHYTLQPVYMSSGNCGANGNNLTYILCDSTLTISGEGELAEYASGEEPWHEHADLIDTIIVPCGKKAYYQSALPDYAERIGYDWCEQYIIDFVNWDGELLQSSLVDRETLPSYNGAMPEKETDELYKYTFIGWTPKVELATDDATYTATYLQRDKFEAIEDVESGESRVKSQKILREGVLYIRRGEKIYTVLGTEMK